MRAFVPGLCISAAVILFSCHDDASLIGSDFLTGSSIAMVTIDTLTLQTSTIKFDSLVTNDATRLMVGYHNDSDLGGLTVGSYFQLGIDSPPLSVDRTTTQYRNTELMMIHDGYSYYDTLETVSFTVHKLTQDIDSQTGYYYNTSHFKYDPTPLGSVTYTPRPARRDTVHIAMSDAFGRDIFTLAQNAGTQVSSTLDFVQYFKGLVLVPSTTSGPIVGFSMSSQVRIYYTDRSVTPSVVNYLTLDAGTALHFNTISSDRSQTNLVGLISQKGHLSSHLTDNKVYVQGGVGLAMRVEIPYLRAMRLENPGLTIVNAALDIYPAKDNKGSNQPLPTQLLLSSVNYKNELLLSYTSPATLVEDFYLGRDTHYHVDITNFVNAQMAIEETNNNALAFTMNDATFRGMVNRIYVGDQKNVREMILTIACLSYSK
jgi:hypothetical protein